eukprot:TRINITY_DN43331_c0_g1_i1.p1 TRINITY_DN43331_c0_g1~~TRINITY_DN43331_c0_g1_i1.p1  ORF type:complete len:593 (+),score=124.08 TRINITY_DN43331_c0_g1_i1:147-1781(+)
MNGEDVCSLLGGFLKTLTDDVRALKEWRDETAIMLGRLDSDTTKVAAMCQEMHVRHARAQQGLRKTQSTVLRDKLATLLRRTYWSKFIGFAQRKRARKFRIANRQEFSRQLFNTTRAIVLKTYFNRLYTFYRAGRVIKTKVRKQSYLAARTEAAIRQRFFSKLCRFHRGQRMQRACVEKLTRRTDQVYRQVYFRMWLGFHARQARNKLLLRGVPVLARRSAADTCKNYFRKLQRYATHAFALRSQIQDEEKKRKLQRRVADTLRRATSLAKVRWHYKLWAAFAKSRKHRNIRELILNVEMSLKRAHQETSDRINNMRAIADQVASQGEEVRDMVLPLQNSIAENQRTLLFVSEQYKGLKDEHIVIRAEGDAALRDAMGEVDHVLSQTRDDLNKHVVRTETELQQHARQIHDEVGETMRRLEMTMADLISRDREAVKEVIDRVHDTLSGKVAHLSGQSDMSLKSLSNTNTVLNKVVDRMITVDKQIEALGRAASKLPDRSSTAMPEPRDVSPERAGGGSAITSPRVVEVRSPSIPFTGQVKQRLF